MEKGVRHLLGLSGGKDSSALAIYMRDRVPEMEYFFSDTGKELPETYDFLDRLEAFLGKPIVRLNMDPDSSKNRDFDHWVNALWRSAPIVLKSAGVPLTSKSDLSRNTLAKTKPITILLSAPMKIASAINPSRPPLFAILNRNIHSKRMASPKRGVYRILEESGPRSA